MKIALIKQRTGYGVGCDRKQYKDRIQGILENTGADIIVGPELAISDEYTPISHLELGSFCTSIAENIRNGGLIIPGTGLVFNEHQKTLRNIAPILTKEEILFFNKKSSAYEKEIADYYGLDYVPGIDSEGIFHYKGLVIAVEVCRDHGIGKLKYSTNIEADLEFILACRLGGFSPDKVIVDNGIIAVNDGGKAMNSDVEKDPAPEVYAFKKENNRFGPIEGEETEDYLLIEDG